MLEPLPDRILVREEAPVLLNDHEVDHAVLLYAINFHSSPSDAQEWLMHSRGDHVYCMDTILADIRERRGP